MGRQQLCSGADQTLVPSPTLGSWRPPKVELPPECSVPADPGLGAPAASSAEGTRNATPPLRPSLLPRSIAEDALNPSPSRRAPWLPGEAVRFAASSSRHRCPGGRRQSSRRPGRAKVTTGLAKEGTKMDGWAGISLKILSFAQMGSSTVFPCSRLRTSMYLSESGTSINNAGFCF